MEDLRIGVIGTGHLGRHHTRLLPQVKGAELSGIYDIDDERMSSISAEFGARCFKTAEELLENSDAVVIAASTSTHAKLARKAFDAGCHVLVEKPIAESCDQGREMVQTAADKGLTLMVGHVEHFNPAFDVASRYLSKPLFVESHRLTIYRGRGADVSVVHDLLIHDLELLLAVMGEVRSMTASGSRILTDSPDIANVRLDFGGGRIANLTASRISLTNMRKMRFFQEGAYVSVDFGGAVEIATLEGGGPNPPENAENFDLPGGEIIRRWNPEVPEGNALLAELQHFADSIHNNSEPRVSGKRGLAALELADRIIEIIEGD
mgnify:CR=1 FL=1